MPRERLEVADIFRAHGAAWRRANAGHVSLGYQRRLYGASEAVSPFRVLHAYANRKRRLRR